MLRARLATRELLIIVVRRDTYVEFGKIARPMKRKVTLATLCLLLPYYAGAEDLFVDVTESSG
ncbi:MAG: hypothetical protein ACR2QU_03740, partial [Gammaproteobacteria bacterium]